MPENTEINELKQTMDKQDAFCKNGRRCISFITGLFILSALVVLPIIYRDYYFDILKFKYYYYIGSVGVFIVLLATVLIYLKIEDVNRFEGKCMGSILPGMKQEKSALLDRMPYMALLAFLIVSALSTLRSYYLYEAFWGNEGRYTGLFLLLIYGIAFTVLSIFCKPERWHMDAFLAASMVVCILGILDFLKIDILHFKDLLVEEQHDMFTSTIGNINTYTAFLSLTLGVSCILFAEARTGLRFAMYFLCMMVSFVALITGRSDNAYLALMAMFGFGPLYLFRTKSGIRRYAVMLAGFFTAIQIVDIICQTIPDRIYPIEGLFNVLVQFGGLAYVVAALWILVGLLYFYKHIKKEASEQADRKLWFGWLGILVIAAAVVIFILIDTNVAGNGARYGGLRGYLEFNDSWGTMRGHAWKMAMEFYNGFPLSKKLIGYGPDTFGILCIDAGNVEVVANTRMVFDNAHNEYLQYLVTVGALGLVAYLTFLISCAVCMVKRGLDNPMVMAAFFAVLCYQAQALVNLNVPISAPVMWTLLSLGIAGCWKRNSCDAKGGQDSGEKQQ